jgi:hypothetical protein
MRQGLVLGCTFGSLFPSDIHHRGIWLSFVSLRLNGHWRKKAKDIHTHALYETYMEDYLFPGV